MVLFQIIHVQNTKYTHIFPLTLRSELWSIVFLVRSIASVSAANSELGFVTHALDGMIPQYASTEVSGVPLCSVETRNNKYVLNVTL